MHCACVSNATNNEERRLGDQRGSDTLVVPFVTSNDGLSIAHEMRFTRMDCIALMGETYPRPLKGPGLSLLITLTWFALS